MPRNASGVYTLPAGNPVVGGTYITAAWCNPTMEDIAAALTDSLSRSGQGGMQVPFKNAAGSVTSPGMTWVNESNTGFYLQGTGDQRVSVQGADKMRWTTTATQLWNGAAWSDIVTELRLADEGYTRKGEAEAITGAWNFTTVPTINGSAIGTAAYTDSVMAAHVAAADPHPQYALDTAVVPNTRLVATALSLTGGGDLFSDLSLSLVNDVASPGATWYYGTNASGTKGWHPLSSVTGVPEAPIDGNTYGRKDASWVAVSGPGGGYVLKAGDTMTGTLTIETASAVALALKVTNASLLSFLGRADGAANEKYWAWNMSGGVFSLAAANDAFSTFNNALAITRNVGAISAMVYGNPTNLPAHTFHGATLFNQVVTMAATLAVTGATTLTGMLTANGGGTFNGNATIRSGLALILSSADNSQNRQLALTTANEVGVNTKGAVWGWTDNTMLRGNVSFTTVAPVGNDVTKAGNVVLVYE